MFPEVPIKSFLFQIGIEGEAYDQVSLAPSDTPALEHHDHGDFIDLACSPLWNTTTTASGFCQETTSWTCDLGDDHHAHLGSPEPFSAFHFFFANFVASSPPLALDQRCL